MELESSEYSLISRRDLIKVGVGQSVIIAAGIIRPNNVEAANCHVQIERKIENYIDKGGNPTAYDPKIDQPSGIISGAATNFKVNNNVVASGISNESGDVLLNVQTDCQGSVVGTLSVTAPDGRFGSTLLTIPNGIRQTGVVWMPENITPVTQLSPTQTPLAMEGAESNPEYENISLSSLDRILGLVGAGIIAAAILLRGREHIVVQWVNWPWRQRRQSSSQEMRGVNGQISPQSAQRRSSTESGASTIAQERRMEEPSRQFRQTSGQQQRESHTPSGHATSMEEQQQAESSVESQRQNEEQERNRTALNRFRERIGERGTRERFKFHISGNFIGDIEAKEEELNE